MYTSRDVTRTSGLPPGIIATTWQRALITNNIFSEFLSKRKNTKRKAPRVEIISTRGAAMEEVKKIRTDQNVYQSAGTATLVPCRSASMSSASLVSQVSA